MKINKKIRRIKSEMKFMIEINIVIEFKFLLEPVF